jgi:hypothetical protein
MYQDVLSAATPTALGVAVLPATGGNTIFTVAAYTAIVIGVSALLLQLAVGVYRLTANK